MKKLLVIIFLVGVLITSTIYYWQSQQVAFMRDKDITSVEFYDLLEKQNSFFVYFYSPTCLECQQAEPIIAEAVKKSDIFLVKINIKNNSGVYDEYELPGVPAILYFENGELVNGIVGFLPDVQGYIDFFTNEAGDGNDF